MASAWHLFDGRHDIVLRYMSIFPMLILCDHFVAEKTHVSDSFENSAKSCHPKSAVAAICPKWRPSWSYPGRKNVTSFGWPFQFRILVRIRVHGGSITRFPCALLRRDVLVIAKSILQMACSYRGAWGALNCPQAFGAHFTTASTMFLLRCAFLSTLRGQG